jgi:hypothetical protein
VYGLESGGGAAFGQEAVDNRASHALPCCNLLSLSLDCSFVTFVAT